MIFVHIEVIEKVIAYAKSIELIPLMLDFSPVKGPEGNIEYLLYLSKDRTSDLINKMEIDVKNVVELSHQTLDKAKD